MIVGDKTLFAIESKITRAYKHPGIRALGYFTLHIGGRRYGVCESDATLLACALDQVEERLSRRGTHTAPFSSAPQAGDIRDAILEAIYSPDPKRDRFFGLPISGFSDFVYSSRCEWHRGCDEAFDDGSAILHFDVCDRVRLIADKGIKQPFDWRHDPETLCDFWISATDFYKILEGWRDAFLAEWKQAPKIHEDDITIPDA